MTISYPLVLTYIMLICVSLRKNVAKKFLDVENGGCAPGSFMGGKLAEQLFRN